MILLFVLSLCLLGNLSWSIQDSFLSKYIQYQWPIVSSYPEANCSWVPVQSSQQQDFYRDVDQCYARNEARMASPKHDYWELLCQRSSLLSFHRMIRALSMLRESKRQILFLGDSLMRQQMIIFGCMLDPTYVFNNCLQDAEGHYTECVSCKFTVGSMILYVQKVGAAFTTDRCIEGVLKEYLSLSTTEKKFTSDDIIVINQGVHHQDEAQQYIRLEELATISVRLYQEAEQKYGKASLPRFIWRETTPQHFPTCNGHYFKEMRSGVEVPSFSCTDSVYPSMLTGEYSGPNLLGPSPCTTGANLRNEVTNSVIEEHFNGTTDGSGEGIQISRVFDALKDTPENFHHYTTASVGKPDCTHYQTHAVIFLNQALLSLLV